MPLAIDLRLVVSQAVPAERAVVYIGLMSALIPLIVLENMAINETM